MSSTVDPATIKKKAGENAELDGYSTKVCVGALSLLAAAAVVALVLWWPSEQGPNADRYPVRHGPRATRQEVTWEASVEQQQHSNGETNFTSGSTRNTVVFICTTENEDNVTLWATITASDMTSGTPLPDDVNYDIKSSAALNFSTEDDDEFDKSSEEPSVVGATAVVIVSRYDNQVIGVLMEPNATLAQRSTILSAAKQLTPQVSEKAMEKQP